MTIEEIYRRRIEDLRANKKSSLYLVSDDEWHELRRETAMLPLDKFMSVASHADWNEGKLTLFGIRISTEKREQHT